MKELFSKFSVPSFFTAENFLFALDAYSQYVYAIPLKDKTAASVLQGFLAIFGMKIFILIMKPAL
jgi:hypothetical protein